MLVLFALLAALLTLVGIYGVISYRVTESTREIGVCVALGANQRDVLSLVVGRSLRLTVAGSLAGVALALAGGRVLGGMLFEVTPTDLPTFAAAIASVVAAGFLASYLPARRALAINPAESLRAE